jgi:hypothetical protein
MLKFFTFDPSSTTPWGLGQHHGAQNVRAGEKGCKCRKNRLTSHKKFHLIAHNILKKSHNWTYRADGTGPGAARIVTAVALSDQSV